MSSNLVVPFYFILDSLVVCTFYYIKYILNMNSACIENNCKCTTQAYLVNHLKFVLINNPLLKIMLSF